MFLGWGTKNLILISCLCLLAAFTYGLYTGGDWLGVLSVGYKGGVGDHLGYGFNLSAGVLAGLAAVVNALLKANVAMSPDGRFQDLPPVAAVTNSYWPAAGALGIACVAVGLVFSVAFLVLGVVLGFVAMVMWSYHAWADSFSADEGLNKAIRQRVSAIFEVPALSVLVAGFVVLGVSRVLLAVSAQTSVVVGSAAALVVFIFALIVAKTKLSDRVISGFVVIGALLVLFGGLVGAVAGERDFSHGHEVTHGDDHGEGNE